VVKGEMQRMEKEKNGSEYVRYTEEYHENKNRRTLVAK
jgi:hypothetical protein